MNVTVHQTSRRVGTSAAEGIVGRRAELVDSESARPEPGAQTEIVGNWHILSQ